MFEVTEKATEKVVEFFKTRDKTEPLRVFVAGMGCSGVQLGMALDEANEDDETFELSGHTYVVARQLLEQAKPIRVDYVSTPEGEGFIISSGMKPSTGCGGGCCGCS